MILLAFDLWSNFIEENKTWLTLFLQETFLVYEILLNFHIQINSNLETTCIKLWAFIHFNLFVLKIQYFKIWSLLLTIFHILIIEVIFVLSVHLKYTWKIKSWVNWMNYCHHLSIPHLGTTPVKNQCGILTTPLY